MLQAKVLTPTVTQLTVEGDTEDKIIKQVTQLLSYTDPALAYQTQRHQRDWLAKKSNPQAWQRRLHVLQDQEKKLLYKIVQHNEWRCRTGSLHLLAQKGLLTVSNIEGMIAPPSLRAKKAYPLLIPLPYALYPYQELALAHLLSYSHAHIEICTGSGKATIALLLAQKMGVSTAIVVPFKENARSLMSFFQHHLGSDRVGLYGDGHKTLGKDVTICIGKSLTNISASTKPDDWSFFRHKRALIVDESHTWAADTMDELCHGLFAHVPYRYFMSGTQEKNEHQYNQLASIIGPRVFSFGTAEAVREGYICPHEYIIYTDVPLAPLSYMIDPKNVLALRRHHLLLNPAINAFVANACMADLAAHQCSLIMAEEINQVQMIVDIWEANGLVQGQDFAVATGKGKVELAVDAFNNGDVGILIGTSCIGTGVNLYPQHKTYNLCGGGAVNSVRTCQGAVGRSVRFAHSNPALQSGKFPVDRFDVKQKTVIIDFDLDHAQHHLHRHLKKRVQYYGLSESGITYQPFSVI